MNFLNLTTRTKAVTWILLVAAIFITRPGKCQESTAGDGKSTVKLKVVTEKNGKTSVLDTTITREGNIDKDELEQMMKELKGQMKELEMEMEGLDREFSFEMSDSADLDSLEREISKVIVIGKDGSKGKMKFYGYPGGPGYNFDFEMPEAGDFPECFSWSGSGNDCWEMPLPSPHRGIMRLGSQGGSSLSDMLGDIPMDRVKGFTIKEKKNGKRIIIDVEDGPVFESRSNTVIIRGDRPDTRVKYRHVKPEKKVKIIIDDEKGSEDDRGEPLTPPDKKDPAKEPKKI